MAKIKFEDTPPTSESAEAPAPNKPNPPRNRAFPKDLVLVRNVSNGSIGETPHGYQVFIHPGKVAVIERARLAVFAAGTLEEIDDSDLTPEDREHLAKPGSAPPP